LVFWRTFDESVIAELKRLSRREIDLIPFEAAGQDPKLSPHLEDLASGAATFLPRDRSGNLHWLLRDHAGRPLYLVRHAAEARAFYDGWLSPSFLVGFVASGLVLVLIMYFFSHTVIRQITRASAILERISVTGEFADRIAIKGHNELARMFTRLNELLDRIALQEDELRARNLQLEDLSRHDPLTGIPNRRFLDEILDRTWRQAVRAGRPISVLLIDVDSFKPFNDNYGHLRGDQVLKQVARTLQDNLHRATDYVARYGGEEFCVILTDTGSNHALLVGETLRTAVQALAIRHDFSSCADVVTVSIGVASLTAQQKVLHLDLIGEADRALYHAKRAGRNRVETGDGSRASNANNPGEH